MNNRIAMFPGSFDPPTLGHIDIIKRASSMYDKLFVVIADNVNKHNLFSSDEIQKLLMHLLSEQKNIEIVVWNGLTVDFAKKNNVGIIIRGIRNSDDFSYELEYAQINKMLLPGIDVLLLPTDFQFSLIRSSTVKELALYGGDVSKMVPDEVAKAISIKYKQLT